jgi:hypothetical protein
LHFSNATRESLLDSTPQLKQADLKKFIEDRFGRAKIKQTIASARVDWQGGRESKMEDRE